MSRKKKLLVNWDCIVKAMDVLSKLIWCRGKCFCSQMRKIRKCNISFLEYGKGLLEKGLHNLNTTYLKDVGGKLVDLEPVMYGTNEKDDKEEGSEYEGIYLVDADKCLQEMEAIEHYSDSVCKVHKTNVQGACDE